MSVAALRFLFSFVDVDKDGLLSHAELATAMQLLGYHPTEVSEEDDRQRL